MLIAGPLVGVHCLRVPAVEDRDDVRTAIASVADKLGHFDFLVNNAGINRDRTLAKMTPEQWDEVIGVDTEDAQAMALRLTREEGLYVGVSAGAAVCAALNVDGKCVVAIGPDAGSRYQSDKFWEAK